jgi:hypothetical protein
MRVKDVITDDFVSDMADAYAREAKGVNDVDRRALKLVLMAAAESAANACGIVPETDIVKDDGSWA